LWLLLFCFSFTFANFFTITYKNVERMPESFKTLSNVQIQRTLGYDRHKLTSSNLHSVKFNLQWYQAHQYDDIIIFLPTSSLFHGIIEKYLKRCALLKLILSILEKGLVLHFCFQNFKAQIGP